MAKFFVTSAWGTQELIQFLFSGSWKLRSLISQWFRLRRASFGYLVPIIGVFLGMSVQTKWLSIETSAGALYVLLSGRSSISVSRDPSNSAASYGRAGRGLQRCLGHHNRDLPKVSSGDPLCRILLNQFQCD